MRISDWSSDVCSSDLDLVLEHAGDVAVPLGGDPDLALGPLRPLAQLPHFRVVPADAVQHGQVAWVEHPGLGAEVLQDALCFQRQLAAVGLRPQRAVQQQDAGRVRARSEEHTSELQSLMRLSYAVFCLKKKKPKQHTSYDSQQN